MTDDLPRGARRALFPSARLRDGATASLSGRLPATATGLRPSGRLLSVATVLLAAATVAAAPTAATAATTTPGLVATWGANGSGQLGDGTTADALAPQPLTGVWSVTALALGETHTVALRGDGTVSAWGGNASGQLGDGTTIARPTPAQVPGVTSATAVAASAATSYALRGDGTVWSWGEGGGGELGRGADTTAGPAATPIAGATAISAGYQFALALRGDGTVVAWGDNSYGQLGRDPGTVASEATPTAVPGLANVVAVAAGGFTAYALLADGTVKAWGYGGYGELGDGLLHDGATAPESLDTPVTVTAPGGGPLADVRQVAGGISHAVALRRDGTVVAWGLSGGEGVSRWAPVVLPGLAGIAEVAATGAEFARGSDGSLWAWGSNWRGLLGVGGGAGSDLPRQVAGASVAGLASGPAGGHMAAVRTPLAPFDSAALTFPEQALGTLSSAQRVTFTNPGGPLTVKRVVATGTDAADFLVVDDGCSGEQLAPEESCTALVRFAPSASGARSAALAVRPPTGAPFTLPLSGTGGQLPQGSPGETGPPGNDGAPGEQGQTGAQGPTGATGGTGAAGPKGSTGPQGARGPRGRDARVTCKLAGSRRVRCTVTYATGAGRARTRAKAATSATLVRGGRTIARGTLGRLQAVAPVARGGKWPLADARSATRPRPIARGRAVLVAGRGSAQLRIAVTVR